MSAHRFKVNCADCGKVAHAHLDTKVVTSEGDRAQVLAPEGFGFKLDVPARTVSFACVACVKKANARI